MIKRAFGPYLSATSSLKYGFVMSLPLLVLYEVLIALTTPDSGVTVRLSTDIWIKSIAGLFGVSTLKFTVFIVLTMGLLVWFKSKDNPVTLHGKFLVYMILESAVWAVVLWWLVSGTIGAVFAFAPDGESLSLGQQFALSLGAGLYEELVFRVLLVPALVVVFAKFGFGAKGSVFAGIVFGALLFSAVHYMGSMGDVFTLQSFTFRFLFGMALNALLMLRGFGIAAWTHSLYDVMVILV